MVGPEVRLVPPDRTHLTLVYYGEVAPAAVGPLGASIAAVAADCPPLRLAPGSAGRFRDGTVLWFGLTGDTVRLARLRDDLVLATAGFGAATAAGDGAPFVPHLTVARLRRRAAGPGAAFAGATVAWGASDRFTADRLTLYRSAGGRYEVLDELPLAGEPSSGG